ncbi:MAG: cobalamin B12-binding domain-containing protein, partial [Bacteroidota bacterium]
MIYMVAESIYKDYQKQLLNGNRLACKDIVENLLKEGIQVRDIYLNLFQRSLYEVGALWEANKISVAIEHMCTAITESLINIVYPYLTPMPKVDKKAVVMCTPGEYHQIGARIVADYFELNQWDSYFLGT